ncbi:MAG TPA: hypothetical protein HPP66_01275, partial [Planctomycetes bacterium]|nr:hypothetical protein [Planctomycetota bacterium]
MVNIQKNNHLSIINNHSAFPNRPNAPKSTASRHTCHSRAGGNPLRHTQYDIRYTSIENQNLAHFRHFSSLFTNFPSTTVVSALQIAHFMQNKPNFQKDQMNVSRVSTKDYEDKTLGKRGKNKPNPNPIQTQSNPIKANKMPKQTQFKPKTNPISEAKKCCGVVEQRYTMLCGKSCRIALRQALFLSPSSRPSQEGE